MSTQINNLGVTFPDGTTQTTAMSSGGAGYSMTKYTSPATWVKPATLKAVKITVVAGGAGGTGGRGAAPPGSNLCSGGGASQVGYAYFPAASIPASPITITVGAGGIGGTPPGGSGTRTVGATGGTSSFGALITATGGPPGSGSPSGPAGGVGTWSSPAPASDQFVYADTRALIGSTNYVVYGRDTSGAMGYGGDPVTASYPAVTGDPGTGYGSGGGGINASVPGNLAYGVGGTGAPGVIIVEEYY